MAIRMLMVASVLALATSSSACTDPVTQDRRAALGGEEKGVPKGPLHRPGQPCAVCHDGSGEEREFILAGTVYAKRDGATPVRGALVTITDANGATFSVETNCAGNFFIRPESFRPAFPVQTAVSYGTMQLSMESPIQREPSCATCHGMEKSTTSTGPIYLWDGSDPPADLNGACP